MTSRVSWFDSRGKHELNSWNDDVAVCLGVWDSTPLHSFIKDERIKKKTETPVRESHGNQASVRK